MAAEIFENPQTDASPIINTATDADSPNTALLNEKYRNLFDLLMEQVFGSWHEGTLTSDPPNDTTGYAIDTAASFEEDEHNGRRILFTSGNAKGQDFLIDDTSAANDRVVCTGDNLYSAGARSGDDYIILGNFRQTSSEGHTHNAVNSAPIEAPLGRTAAFSIGYTQDCKITDDSYRTAARIRLYIPSNPTTLTMRGTGAVTAGTGYVRAEITDSGTTEFNSSEDTFTATSLTEGQEISISRDLSTADQGWADVDIELKNSSSVQTTYLLSLTAYWNT